MVSEWASLAVGKLGTGIEEGTGLVAAAVNHGTAAAANHFGAPSPSDRPGPPWTPRTPRAGTGTADTAVCGVAELGISRVILPLTGLLVSPFRGLSTGTRVGGALGGLLPQDPLQPRDRLRLLRAAAQKITREKNNTPRLSDSVKQCSSVTRCSTTMLWASASLLSEPRRRHELYRARPDTTIHSTTPQ